MVGPGMPQGRARVSALPPRRFLTPAVALLLVLLVTVAAPLLTSGRQQAAPPDTVGPVAPPAAAHTTAAPSAPATTGPARARPTGAAPAASRSAPAWISISAAGVEAPLVPQGLSADGTIDPARQEVIWFTGGDRVAPGQAGTAVIAAHVTWEGAPDAFVRLAEVTVGDVVTLGYEDGSARSFTVTETAAVDKQVLARSLTVWGPHPRAPRLAIITCDPVLGLGPDGHTQANFVVIAEA